MKKLLSCLVIFLLLFSSCSKDDSPDETNGDQTLIGKWEIHTIIEYDEEGDIYEEDFYQPGERIWEFKKNGYVHINESGGMNRDVEYQYKSREKELVVMGILLKVRTLNSKELIVRDGQHEMQYRKL